MIRWHTFMSRSLSLLLTALLPLTSWAQSVSPSPSPEDFSLEGAPATLQNQSLYKQINPLPLVYVTALNATVAAANQIEGSFEVQNTESAAVANIQYELQILQPLPAVATGTLVADAPAVYDRHLFAETFSLQPRDTKKVAFTFDAKHLPAGAYRVRIQLSQTNDRPLGWGDTTIQLVGEAPFVIIETDAVEVASVDPITKEEKTTWGPMEGPNVVGGQSITLRAFATAIGSTDIQGKAVVEVERLLSSDRNVATHELKDVSVPAGDSVELALPLSTETVPGAYRVLLSLFDGAGRRVSGVGEFRYVVTGPSASIVSQLVEQLPSQQGDMAQVSFTIAGAADRLQSVTGTLEVTIVDDNGVIGQAENTLTIHGTTPAQGTATMALQADRCGVPKVILVAKAADGSELDRYEAAYPNLAASCVSAWTLSRPMALGIAAAIVMLGSIAYFVIRLTRRRKGSLPTTPVAGSTTISLIWMLLAGSAVILFLLASRSAEANGIQYVLIAADDPNDPFEQTRPSLYVASPAHDSLVSSDTVSYSARLSWINCDNVAAQGFLRVYANPDGGKVTWSAGHPWVSLAQETLALPKLCKRCDTRVTRTVALSGNLRIPNLIPGTSATLWTYGSNAGSWRGGSILQDFTWLTYPAPPTPTPVPTSSPIVSPTSSFTPTFTPVTSGSPLTQECGADSPEIVVNPTAESGGRYVHAAADGDYRVEIFSPRGLRDGQYVNYTWANWPTDDKARHHGSSLFVIKNSVPTFTPDTDPSTSILGGFRVANATTAIDTTLSDPPYSDSRSRVANAARGADTTVSLRRGDYLTLIVNAIKGVGDAQGGYARNTGSVHVRICPASTATPSPTPTNAADLSLTMQGPSTIRRDQQLHYSLQVTNQGPLTATQVVISDTIPAGLTFNAALSSSACTATSTKVTCSLPSLNSGASSLLSIAFNISQTFTCRSDVRNQASVTSATPDSSLANNTTPELVTNVTCPQCSDTEDNDADQRIDASDPACHQDFDLLKPYLPNKLSEVDTQCTDLVDNDADQLLNEQDPGCHVGNDISNPYIPADNTESGAAPFDPGGFKETE